MMLRPGTPPSRTITPDPIGWAILCELQGDARISFSELGRRVGLTPPAVADRVRRLSREGVLVGYRVDVDLARLGLGVEAMVLLDASNGVTSKRFRGELASLEGVLRCDRVTGDESYMLRVATPGVPELHELLDQLGPYGTVRSWIVLDSPARGSTVVDDQNGRAARVIPECA